ncbi:MAG: sigma-70 family RNA polymerase sigma factor [Planctomycetes bacterium]|nr:sigma-70 family RNA polymerase sigma factor [Planctomycetota bacterium]
MFACETLSTILDAIDEAAPTGRWLSACGHLAQPRDPCRGDALALCRLVIGDRGARLPHYDEDDLFQETIIVLLRNPWRASGGMGFAGWFRLIARSAYGMALRRARPDARSHGEIDPDLAVARDPDPLDALEAQERGALVRACLDRLPADEKQAIVLHDIRGRTFEELAKALGLSKTALFRRYRKGHERLRRALDDSSTTRERTP